LCKVVVLAETLVIIIVLGHVHEISFITFLQKWLPFDSDNFHNFN
jgi:hypothetical protein